MWTKHHTNTEKLQFLTREKHNMDTGEEDILAIKINLVNMVDVFTNLQIDHISSIRNYCKKKKDTRNICFCRQITNIQWLKGN